MGDADGGGDRIAPFLVGLFLGGTEQDGGNAVIQRVEFFVTKTVGAVFRRAA